MVNEFKSILDLINRFPDEQSCINHLEYLRWNGVVVSPFDKNSVVYKCKGNRYRCKNTKKYFNVKTGTIFEDTKIPLQKWFMALYIFSSHRKGISSHQLARDIDVTQKTAWFLLHRLRYAFDHPLFKRALSGEVETDEAYMGGIEYNKHWKKRLPGCTGRYHGNKLMVIGSVERGGNVMAQIIPNGSYKTVEKVLFNNIVAGATVYTDTWPGYARVGQMFNHLSINHSAGQYVDGNIHTNTIEGFWAYFRRGVYGIYHSVSPKHLQPYLDEFCLRYSTRFCCENERFNVILLNMTKRLTYKDLISDEQ